MLKRNPSSTNTMARLLADKSGNAPPLAPASDADDAPKAAGVTELPPPPGHRLAVWLIEYAVIAVLLNSALVEVARAWPDVLGWTSAMEWSVLAHGAASATALPLQVLASVALRAGIDLSARRSTRPVVCNCAAPALLAALLVLPASLLSFSGNRLTAALGAAGYPDILHRNGRMPAAAAHAALSVVVAYVAFAAVMCDAANVVVLSGRVRALPRLGTWRLFTTQPALSYLMFVASHARVELAADPCRRPLRGTSDGSLFYVQFMLGSAISIAALLHTVAEYTRLYNGIPDGRTRAVPAAINLAASAIAAAFAALAALAINAPSGGSLHTDGLGATTLALMAVAVLGTVIHDALAFVGSLMAAETTTIPLARSNTYPE